MQSPQQNINSCLWLIVQATICKIFTSPKAKHSLIQVSAVVHPARCRPDSADGALREVLAALCTHSDVSASREHSLVNTLVPADYAFPGLALRGGWPLPASPLLALPGPPRLCCLPQVRPLALSAPRHGPFVPGSQGSPFLCETVCFTVHQIWLIANQGFC